jgi:hypothetical protein
MHCKLYYISFLYTNWSNQRNVPGAEISSNSVPKYFIHKCIAKINFYQECDSIPNVVKWIFWKRRCISDWCRGNCAEIAYISFTFCSRNRRRNVVAFLDILIVINYINYIQLYAVLVTGKYQDFRHLDRTNYWRICISSVIFIDLLNLTRSNCETYNYRPLRRNWTSQRAL